MKCGLSLILLLLAAGGVRADIAGFGRRPTRPPLPLHPAAAVPLSIEAGANDKPARLLIPRALLGRAAKGRRVGVLDRSLPLGTALALAFGALCFFGYCGRRKMVIGLLFLLAAGIGGGGVALVWASPPQISPKKIALPVSVAKNLSLDTVQVEIRDEGDRLRLIIPARQWAEWAKK